MQKTIIGILLSCSILLSGCTRTYKVDYPQKYAKLLTEQLGDWKVVDSFERHFSGKFSLPYNATFWEIEYTDYKGNARELTIRNDINIYVCLLDYTMDMLEKEYLDRISALDDEHISSGLIDYYIGGEEIAIYGKDGVKNSKKVLDHIIIKECGFDTLTNYNDITVQFTLSYYDEYVNETERIIDIWNKLTETLEKSKVSLCLIWDVPDSDEYHPCYYERYTGYLYYDNKIIINWDHRSNVIN